MSALRTIKKGIVPFASVELTQVVPKGIKAKEAKMSEGEIELSQETFKWLFCSGSDLQWNISVEPARGQKIEEHVVPDLDVRNDENRPSLTSGAVAEELQEASLKNTIDGLADWRYHWKGWRYHWKQKYRSLVIHYTGRNAGILIENWKVTVFLKYDVPQHRI